jgi:hypothetical protein
MSDWLHGLRIVWMALLIFGLTYFVSAAICAIVLVLAVGERARSFKALSSGLLAPLGIIFGVFVGFTAAQVWSDYDRATEVVDREATALNAAVTLAANFPGESETRLRAFVRDYIAEAADEEWPMMAHRTLTLRLMPTSLAEALQFTLALTPINQGQQIAQRDLSTALENAMEARRQRIVISRLQVNWVKWTCLCLQGACALVVIAMVYSENRLSAAIATGIFATGVAASMLLIASHDRPFVGEISVEPAPLLQVMREADGSQAGNPAGISRSR